jgi:hypothetical protein
MTHIVIRGYPDHFQEVIPFQPPIQDHLGSQILHICVIHWGRRADNSVAKNTSELNEEDTSDTGTSPDQDPRSSGR